MSFIGKLGRRKLDPARVAHVPLLATYAAQASLPPPPASQDWYSKVQFWPMLANDKVGDCAIAAPLHAIQQWNAYSGNRNYLPTDDVALRLYEQIGGYNPQNPMTDRGCQMIDVLHAWQNGLDVGGFTDTLKAPAVINILNPEEMKYAISWFGSVNAGVELPLSIYDSPDTWVVPATGLVGRGAKGSLGGHDILFVGYDPPWLYAVSWGNLVRVSWEFWWAYGEEAYAMLSEDFMKPPGVTPADVPWNSLLEDWQQIVKGIPVISSPIVSA